MGIPRATKRHPAPNPSFLRGPAAAVLLLAGALLAAPAWAQNPVAEESSASVGVAGADTAETVGTGETAPVGTVKLSEVEWAGLVWGSEDGYRPAPMLSSHVEMRVAGLVARTRLTQRFENASGDWVEGLYLFPLPEDAAVDQLRLVIGDRVLEGEIQEKEEARRTYETAKVAGKKATLVEQARPNVFTTRVANVAPGEAVEVVIELQQTVRWDAGEMSLRFPTVVNPRFTPEPGEDPLKRLDPPLLASLAAPLPVLAATITHDPWTEECAGPGPWGAAPRLASHAGLRSPGVSLADTSALALAYFPVPPSGSAGPPEPVNPVTFAVELDAGFPLEYLDAPYHPVDVEVAGGSGERPLYRVRLADGAPVSAERDFELVWAPRRDSEPRAAVFSEEHQGDTYSLLLVLPPDGAEVGAGADGGWGALDRELIFILDVSGSMHGAALEQAKSALGTVLDGLHAGDTFNVIAFSDRARALFPDSLPATAEAVEKARGWVDALVADGGTQMLPALAAALDGGPGYRQGGSRTVKQVVFLTDGAVGNEADLFGYIAAHVGEARLFTVGIGPAPNAHFMRRAAEEGRGSYVFIGDPAEVALKVESLARKLESPVLTALDARWDDPTAETWPRKLGDLYAGEPLMLAARTVGSGGSVELTGRTGGAFWSQTVDLTAVDLAPGAARAGLGGSVGATHGVVRAARLGADASGELPGSGVRQLWARAKIAALESRLVTGADPAEVRRRVIDVALAHHLVSTYTSLVAVDRTPERPDGAPLATRPTPQASPAGWTPPGTLPVGATAWPFRLTSGLLLLLFAVTVLVLLRRGLGGAMVDPAPVRLATATATGVSSPVAARGGGR